MVALLAAKLIDLTKRLGSEVFIASFLPPFYATSKDILSISAIFLNIS